MLQTLNNTENRSHDTIPEVTVAIAIDHMRDDVTFLATVNALLGSHFEWIRNGEELLCCRLF